MAMVDEVGGDAGAVTTTLCAYSTNILVSPTTIWEILPMFAIIDILSLSTIVRTSKKPSSSLLNNLSVSVDANEPSGYSKCHCITVICA